MGPDRRRSVLARSILDPIHSHLLGHANMCKAVKTMVWGVGREYGHSTVSLQAQVPANGCTRHTVFSGNFALVYVLVSQFLDYRPKYHFQ